jgi:squalene-hopene/tetraprenyl-beta-curcumene cyclase
MRQRIVEGRLDVRLVVCIFLLCARWALAQPPAVLGVDRALRTGLEKLRSMQQKDGCWVGTLESDVAATSLYVALTHYLEQVSPADEGLLVQYLRASAIPAGGWAAYPGGPMDLDASVQAYTALKLAGTNASDPLLTRARSAIRSAGGLEATSVGGRMMLVYLGVFPPSTIPYLTPKIASLPEWFHPNLYDLPLGRMALVPLSLLAKRRAVRPVDEAHGVRELLTGARQSMTATPADNDPDDREIELISTAAFPAPRPERPLLGVVERWLGRMKARLQTGSTLTVMKTLGMFCRLIDRLFPAPDADRRALQWLMEHQEADGTFAGVTPLTTLGLMALDSEPGKPYRDKVLRGLATLRSWCVRDERGLWLQCAVSNTWDTAQVLKTMLACGASETDPSVQAALRWLLEHQAKRPGDWAKRFSTPVAPGGWAFGLSNDGYVDTDDTAAVLTALYPIRHLCQPAFQRGLNWLLAMQDPGGGWAGWDRNNRDHLLVSIESVMPGAGDLPDIDITARVLAAIGPLIGTPYDDRHQVRGAAQRAMDFLGRHRERDGSWYGHWCINYAYGTAQVLHACLACGMASTNPVVASSVQWLAARQNADGGWGESRRSYETRRFEPGPSNPMVTATIVDALVGARQQGTQTVQRAIKYLVDTQSAARLWEDPGWNGVLIVNRYYLRYGLTPTCLALNALIQYSAADSRGDRSGSPVTRSH